MHDARDEARRMSAEETCPPQDAPTREAAAAGSTGRHRPTPTGDVPATDEAAPGGGELVLPPVAEKIPEGGGNLRRREEWFQRRAGRQP